MNVDKGDWLAMLFKAPIAKVVCDECVLNIFRLFYMYLKFSRDGFHGKPDERAFKRSLMQVANETNALDPHMTS